MYNKNNDSLCSKTTNFVVKIASYFGFFFLLFLLIRNLDFTFLFLKKRIKKIKKIAYLKTIINLKYVIYILLIYFFF